MYNTTSEVWLPALYVASLISVLLLQPGRPPTIELEHIKGVAMVTGRILNVPEHIVGQPLPITDNLAAGETNYSVA